MRRREFITLIGGAAAWPVAARAQSVPVIGLLGSTKATDWAPFVGAFINGLNQAGMVEGRDFVIEYRWADDQYDRLPALAADLVQRRVSVIAALTTPAAVAAKAASPAIPVVFVTISDPVQLGLVASLNRPGGTATGATYLNVEIGPKLLELLHEVVPAATSLAVLVNPTSPNNDAISANLKTASSELGLELHVLNAINEQELDEAFAKMAELKAGGLMMIADALLYANAERLAGLALRYRVPAIFQTRTFAAAGGLMSYGGSAADAYRQAGSYAARVLRGEKPDTLPVQQTTKVELIVNLKTANQLGLSIPLSLLGRANEVIE